MNEATETKLNADVAGQVDPLVILRGQDGRFEYMYKYWYSCDRPQDVKLTPVHDTGKSMLYNFIIGEEMTLLLGEDGRYYTVANRIIPYGDVTTEIEEFGTFRADADIEKALTI